MIQLSDIKVLVLSASTMILSSLSVIDKLQSVFTLFVSVLSAIYIAYRIVGEYHKNQEKKHKEKNELDS